jgi:hypothetical protein
VEGDSSPRLYWNSQKVSDIVLRSRLGGWTSTQDMRPKTSSDLNRSSIRLNDIFPNMKVQITDPEERKKIANKYRFTTSTQE